MNKNYVKDCKVCGSTKNVYNHYCVRTCKACGAFFSRYLQQKLGKFECICLTKTTEIKNKIVVDKNTNKEFRLFCKGCRLEKCLAVGMRKPKIPYLRYDICPESVKDDGNEDKDTKGCEDKIVTKNQTHVASTFFTLCDADRIEINSLIKFVDAKRRILHAFTDLDDIFLEGPLKLEDIILSGFNVFNLINSFSPNPSPISEKELDEWRLDIETVGIFNKRVIKSIIVERMVFVAFARTMPVFMKLSLSDQIALLRHTLYYGASFVNSYLSYELGADTFIRKDFVMPVIGILHCEYLKNDDLLIKLADSFYTKPVERIKKAAISIEEFSLLLAIFFTQSNANGLSPTGKELLYQESVRYTKMLLRYNQQKFGEFCGASRLDECFRVFNYFFENGKANLMFASHKKFYYPNLFKKPDFI
uniref:Nuclear receptor domain-containing protein n=1 Tax=Meloidogyne enterolobii TaxID=390850 RepID=A0A6V7TL29_MELEN|nr:unnamed protein product [Meloidogyne enterolobii]